MNIWGMLTITAVLFETSLALENEYGLAFRIGTLCLSIFSYFAVKGYDKLEKRVKTLEQKLKEGEEK